MSWGVAGAFSSSSPWEGREKLLWGLPACISTDWSVSSSLGPRRGFWEEQLWLLVGARKLPGRPPLLGSGSSVACCLWRPLGNPAGSRGILPCGPSWLPFLPGRLSPRKSASARPPREQGWLAGSVALKMTDVQVDSSRLPPVQEVRRDFAVLEDGALACSLQEQEIEQHYASNVQKSRLVQKDIRIAKELQGREEEEEGSQRHSAQQQQIEESDSHTARAAVQEDIRRKAGASRQREERDQEIAQRLQDLEEEAAGRQQKRRLLGSPGRAREDGLVPLNWAMAGLALRSRELLLRQDEELARRLQREEERQTRLRARKTRQCDDDYRVAQVAQDEEIARYMQEQELEAQQRTLGPGVRGAAHSLSAQEVPAGMEASPPSQKGEEEAAAAPPGFEAAPHIRSLGRRSAVPARGGQADPRLQLCRNIAEDLDPTFKAKRTEAPVDGTAAHSSQAASPGRLVPVDGFFDYLDEAVEAAFVSPTKRQPEKTGRPKSREKKEGCKQQ
ncbi:uncharacterized protein LOC128338737 isoform X2 [Hemicordylus capensis]|uniref:uncharacterized protein LOC128338737 isoform X2 n=1 Tax=Hemicordylus capensis TaxID=884348 RepID=UPI002302273F|nr:uncharacterized protein LOC128338737 isoform X2 [Hemicordylus capensis]